jgi:hypothetical protein
MRTEAEHFPFLEGENARDNNKGEEKGAALMMVEILPLLRLGWQGSEGEPALEIFRLILRAHARAVITSTGAIQMCVAFAFRLRAPRSVASN